MAEQTNVLKKIVALKRQSAEQRMQTLQIEADRLEAAIAALGSALRAMDSGHAGFDAHRLSEANGHARKLIADMNAARAALRVKREELGAAREALKRAFHSEEQLGRTLP